MVKNRLPRRCIQRAFQSVKYLPTDCIQRAFLRWLNENRAHFMVPLRLTKISAKGLELHFQNYPGCLSVALSFWGSDYGLRVEVKWQGQPWDALIDFDVSPYIVPGGYKCMQCVHEKGESATLFSSSEALWQDHLFAPFQKWVNEKLAPARWLRISCFNDKSCTWAELIQNESKLSEPDRTLILMQQLKRLDDKPVYDGGPDGVTNWLLPLKSETC